MDALIARENGQLLKEPEWPEADVIVGNPPFLGGSKMRRELGEEYVNDLWKLYEGRIPAGADLVCYWFEKAREQIQNGRTLRAGLLATNSIRGGSNRRVLERIKQTGAIFFAESDRPWVLEGAAVRVSMVGFDDGTEQERILDGTATTGINPDLTGSLDLSMARLLKENKGLGFRGNQKGGPFDITGDLARAMLAAPINANGRRNDEVLRPWVNGLDITRRPRDMWIIDFGVDMPLEEAALYELPFEYVKEQVYPIRAAAGRGEEKDKWWIHERPRPEMRVAIRPLQRYIATTHTSKHRLFVWFEGRVLPDHALISLRPRR